MHACMQYHGALTKRNYLLILLPFLSSIDVRTYVRTYVRTCVVT